MSNANGQCIVFSSPSGAGKTTIVRHLLNENDSLAFSISATNRDIRKGEREGRDYYFLSTADFRERIEEGSFVEWEEVYEGRYYGTLWGEVERLWREGKQVVFDVDVVGALNLKKVFGERAITIFVQPPSLDALRERLKHRGTETGKALEERLERAEMEMRYAAEFDAVILNDDLDKAMDKARRIIGDFLAGKDEPVG